MIIFYVVMLLIKVCLIHLVYQDLSMRFDLPVLNFFAIFNGGYVFINDKTCRLWHLLCRCAGISEDIHCPKDCP